MKLKIAQVIGLNTDQKAAQVISVLREDNCFLAVLDLTSDDAFTRGRQALSEVSDFYFDFQKENSPTVYFEGTPAEKLTATFEEAEKKFASDQFALLVAAISGNILYLIGQGAVEVYLKRSDKLSPLLSVGAPSQLISGFLKMGDRVLLATSSLVSFLADDLSKSLDLPTDTFEEEVTDRIGAATPENQGLAGLVIEVEQEDIPKLPQEEISAYQPTESPSITKRTLAWFKFLWQKKAFLPKTNKGRLFVAVVLIIIIALGVGYQVKVSRDAQKQAAFNQALQQSKDDFNAAKGLASLNPAEAKLKLDAAKGNLAKALGLKLQDKDAQNLKKQIEQESSSILLQSSVADFPLFLDLDLVKKNFRASQMSLSSGKLLLLDPAVKTLISIDLVKKSPLILAGSEQLGEADYLSLNGELAFVYSKDKGILKIDSTNQKVTTVAKKDTEWGEIKDIYGFAGNIYLLDSSQIFKYLPTKDGYSDKREYLTKTTKADFALASRMQIESSIYVLKKDGEMLRFTKGDKDNFSYGGLDKGVKDPKSFFVSSDTDNLYLLDSGNSRLLILTKTGSYKGTISGDKFAQASDLVVDEKGKKVYLLEGSKIYQVDLK